MFLKGGERPWKQSKSFSVPPVRCPAVEITDRGVTIGEDENTVELTHAEWNDLVARIRRGELTEVR